MSDTVAEEQEQTETPEPEAPETGEPEPDEEEEDAEQQPDTETEEEAPHPGPLTENESAQVFDKAIKRAKTYMASVPTILGDSAAELALCPRCTDLLPGFVLPLHVKPVTPEQKVAVKQSIGELGDPELMQADDAFTCAKCDGWGKVKTGAKRPDTSEGKCLECDGRGWVGARLNRIRSAGPVEVAATNGTEAGMPEPAPATDPWGRTQDDVLYGVMPGFERV